MASEIVLSAAVRNNLLSLQNTADLLGKTQQRLATGLKVNSALDDPTAFFTASSLSSRANDLSRLLDSVGLAVQTVKAADTGIKAITDLVESAQASARQALQSAGQATVSEVEGAASAVFNPNALTTIVGTGATAATPDAAASGVNVALATTTDTDIAETGTALTAATVLTTLVADGDNFTITVDSTVHTITFSAAATAITGDDLNFDTATDVTALIGQLDTLLGANVTVTDGGTGAIDIAASASVDTIRFTDGTQGTNVAELGLGAAGSGGGTTDRLSSRNATLEGLASSNATLQVDLGASTLGTITFGNGTGQVSNISQYVNAVDALTGVSATEAAGVLTISTTDTNDADSAVTLTGNSNATLETALGFGPDAVGGSVTTFSSTNLLSVGNDLTAGDTLSLTIGTQLTTVTFGNGTGQVSTLKELNTTLSGISAGSVSVTETGASAGNISLTNSNAGDAIKLGGSVGTAARFGLTEGEFSNLVNGTTGPVQQGDTLDLKVGTNATLSVTFGTGVGEVNTIAELTSSLTSLAGGTASVDTTTGAVTITATTSTDDIIVTDSTPARSAAAFGLTAGTFTSVTTNNAQRSSLESQFNSVLDQLDDLARDAKFNGNNLLQSGDLKVIFNEDATSQLKISGVDFDASGLGINRASVDSFQGDTAINTTLDELDTAVASLRTQASVFGSNLSVVETRQQFTKELNVVLETGAANLTLADTNEEGANLLALQTRQQLSSVALSLASQAEQQVLRLF